MNHHSIRVVSTLTLSAFLLVACSKTETTHTTITRETAATDTYATSTTSTAMTASTSTMATPSIAVAPADQDFIAAAAKGGMAEVAMGEMGVQRSANAEVKAFSERIVKDHTNANNELTQLASTRGVTLPVDMGEDHKATSGHLGGLPASEFDKAYMTQMIEDHIKDIAAFETASQTATDPELKAFAAKTLPILMEHLQMAKNTQAKLK